MNICGNCKHGIPDFREIENNRLSIHCNKFNCSRSDIHAACKEYFYSSDTETSIRKKAAFLMKTADDFSNRAK